jgi:predicted amidophosphoribosyltransferase
MAENIGNCSRCKRLFKLTASGKCAPCSANEQEQFSQCFQLLQRNSRTGGIHINTLAMETGMAEHVIEEYYIEGKWGTAAEFLNFSCKKCGAEYSGKEGHGSICITCRAFVSSEAGVSMGGRDEVKEKHKTAKKADLLSRVRHLGESGGMRVSSSDFRRS